MLMLMFMPATQEQEGYHRTAAADRSRHTAVVAARNLAGYTLDRVAHHSLAARDSQPRIAAAPDLAGWDASPLAGWACKDCILRAVPQDMREYSVEVADIVLACRVPHTDRILMSDFEADKVRWAGYRECEKRRYRMMHQNMEVDVAAGRVDAAVGRSFHTTYHAMLERYCHIMDPVVRARMKTPGDPACCCRHAVVQDGCLRHYVLSSCTGWKIGL